LHWYGLYIILLISSCLALLFQEKNLIVECKVITPKIDPSWMPTPTFGWKLSHKVALKIIQSKRTTTKWSWEPFWIKICLFYDIVEVVALEDNFFCYNSLNLIL